MSPSTETVDSNLKTTVLETKESKEITVQGTLQKSDVQNSQNFTDDGKSIV